MKVRNMPRKTRNSRRWCVAILIAYIGLCSKLSFAQVQSFQIEQIFSAPFPSDLVASPMGGRFAWVFNLRGSRNIWVAESGQSGYHARALTAYAGDDGVDIGELCWDAKGNTVLFVRGGDLEGGGTDPNPVSLPSGAPKQEIFAVSASGGQPRKLAEGNSPAVSPKEDLVAYLAKDQVWLARLDGSGEPQPAIHEKGSSGSLRWSPDGSKLAFVSRRTDHSFIGVYDVAKKSVIWLSPSVDRDADPTWSPDGRSVAFLRIPAGVTRISGSSAEPWSIWIADAARGTGRQIWKASPGPGNQFQGIESENQLRWAAGDRIIFPSENTGWLHLYSISSQGGPVQELTPGNFEVFTADLSPDRSRVVYSSNERDIDRNHLWEVSATGASPHELTPGQGIEVFPAVADNATAFLHSDARIPMHISVIAGSGAVQDVASDTIPKDFPVAKLTEPQQVIFPAADGLAVHGQLFLPPAANNATRHPAVIFFHGGPTRQMFLGWHPMDAYHYMYGMNQYLASKGYVVLSLNYRGGTGYGHDFRQPPNFGAGGASEYNDTLGAANYLRGRSDVDPKRIGLWGGSYGGYMTALGLARNSDLFAAGVDYAGVHDWRPLRSLAAQIASAPAEQAQVAFNSSPVASMKAWRSPVLVIQGDDDRNVPFAQSVELIEELRKQGVPFEQIVVPDEVHDSLLWSSWLTFFQATDDFFKRHLRWQA